jgi:hypothetical protein
MVAFDYVGYVATGWVAAVVLVGLYALSVVRRGRRLSRRVPPGDRRWT